MEVGLQNKIESIQILRFFAAFSVMLVHIPLFEFGIWGVDIFFVISGFIMMYVTENNENNFFIKRVIRIVPLYWILTLGVFTIALLKPQFLNNTTANFEHLIKSLLFIPFDKNGIGHYPILFLGWTLNFEVIFYLLFGVSLFFFKKYKFIVCTSLIILFYFFCTIFSKKHFVLQAYSNPMFFEFIFGMIAFIVWKKYKEKIKKSLLNNFIFIFLILSTAVFFYYLNSLTYPDAYPTFLAYGIPSFFLILYFVIFLNKIKFPKIFTLLGDASYCIYLINPYIINLFYQFVNLNNYNIPIQFILNILLCFIVFMISIFVYKIIELPINKKFRKYFIIK